jgi:hypothetical protein
MKTKRLASLSSPKPFKPLLSALLRDETNINAALDHYGRALVLTDWFTLFEELGRMDRWLLTLEVFSRISSPRLSSARSGSVMCLIFHEN